MNPEVRRNALLVVLILVAAFAGGRWVLDRLGAGAGAMLGGSGLDSVDVESLLGIEVAELRTDDLVVSGGELTPGRDPWRFGPASTPKPQPRPPAPKPDVVKPKAPKPSAVEPAKPEPPPIDLVFLGNFGPTRRKIAVFDDGETVYIALIGDVVKEKFQVHQIGFESVDLTFVGFPDEPPKRLAIGG